MHNPTLKVIIYVTAGLLLCAVPLITASDYVLHLLATDISRDN